MSQENVELTRQAYDALNRRDLDAFLVTMDTDVDAVSLLVAMEGDYHGHAGIRRWWESLLNAFPDFAIEVVEVRDLGDVALATLRTRGHGSDTDTPFEMPLWQLVRCCFTREFRHSPARRDRDRSAVSLSHDSSSDGSLAWKGGSEQREGRCLRARGGAQVARRVSRVWSASRWRR
jgi:ketosteroid isomerase-like protein